VRESARKRREIKVAAQSKGECHVVQRLIWLQVLTCPDELLTSRQRIGVAVALLAHDWVLSVSTPRARK